MKWISIKKYGLPEPDGNKEYFVIHDFGYGYGTYDYEFGETIYHPEGKYRLSDGTPVGQYETPRLETTKWFLDFDAVGHENEITHYMLINNPEDN